MTASSPAGSSRRHRIGRSAPLAGLLAGSLAGLLAGALLGCAPLPTSDPSATATTVASPTGPASTPAEEPSTGIPSFPTVSVPTATPSGETAGALQTTTVTLDGRSGSASWKISVPEFSGAPVAEEVNRRVRAAAGDLIAQVRREAAGDEGVKRTLTGEGTVVTNDGRTAQVTIAFVDYLAGTARPAQYVTTTVVDVLRARPVRLREVFSDLPAALESLRPQIVAAAEQEGQQVDESGLAPEEANWAAWQTTPDGMVFSFAEYQLGGAGIRTYTVPWEVVQPMLSARGEELLAPT